MKIKEILIEIIEIFVAFLLGTCIILSGLLIFAVGKMPIGIWTFIEMILIISSIVLYKALGIIGGKLINIWNDIK